MSASFVDAADGFVAAFGSLTEWNHVDRAGNDLTGVAPIAEGTDRLSAGAKEPTVSQPGRQAVGRGWENLRCSGFARNDWKRSVFRAREDSIGTGAAPVRCDVQIP